MIEKKDVLIVGGGISGITAALDLAQTGVSTALIEREPSLGGLSGSFSCKASEACNKCFACVVDKRILDITRRQDISVFTRTELLALKRDQGRYTATLKTGRERCELTVSAIVVASGIDPYDASEKAEYGYGRLKNVITARDLDEMLRNQGKVFRPSDGRLPETIAFVQCVGSRDESIGHLYCSQVCCAYALRLIRAIRYQFPEVKAAFLYSDIQPAGASFQELLAACQADQGIRLIRSLPSKVYLSPSTGSIRVRITDSAKGDVVEEPFDLVVLSTGIVLKKDAKPLSKLLGLSFTEDGFFSSPPPETGVFLAGACKGPMDIDRSLLHAKSTAHQVFQYLNGRK